MQKSLDEFKCMKLWDIKDSKKIKVHQEIYNIIAMDNQPFSIVEDKGFIEQLAN